MDPNREILEAAQGNSLAIRVYREFHASINHAKKRVKQGLILDFHGQVVTEMNCCEPYNFIPNLPVILVKSI